jgi:hypothetical protein
MAEADDTLQVNKLNRQANPAVKASPDPMGLSAFTFGAVTLQNSCPSKANVGAAPAVTTTR